MASVLVKRLRFAAVIVGGLVLLAGLFAAWFHHAMKESLPQLDGTRPLGGLGAPVTIARDALGTPTVRGASRPDVARALGFLHAQDRFFQMDLLRRRGAGELAELFGKSALPLDRATRPHHFRELARQVLARLSPDERALLDAYTAGVNAGLAALGRKPFEYLALRAEPQPWRAEDSLLIVYTMTLDLQDPTDNYEHSLMTLRDRYGDAAVAFFAPLLTPDDAALDGSTAPLAPIPGPKNIDLRSAAAAARPPAPPAVAALAGTDPELRPGSNCFALSGAHTANGAGLLANDPHLNLGVPNLWYRAVLAWPEDSAPGAAERRLVGVTIPGLPFVVLGSNGHVAWGFTDAYADTNDLVAVDVNAVSHDLYKIPGSDELVKIETRRDTIKVKGGADETVETQWTHWGPVVGADFRERPLSHHWVADDPAAVNLEFIRLETADTTVAAVAAAPVIGIPAHNFIAVDRAGTIGWTIIGQIPKRQGFDGRIPVSWSYGDRGWVGLTPPAEVPAILAPESGRLWTANNRVVGGAALAVLGDGGYASPLRAAQVRDDLAKLEHATPRDLLEIQTDDRARFLERWQKLLLATLTPEAVEAKSARGELRRLVAQWEGRASVDSVSYRLVRAFRTKVSELALQPVFARCVEEFPDFDWRRFNYEPALETMLREKPMNLLAPEYASWDALLLAAADGVVEDLRHAGVSLPHATWGARNTAQLKHPFGYILPGFLAGWLAMPAEPLPGDVNMPRVQTPTFGASMRLVVSPGHEEEGIFEMPGGESGHPLSPYFRAGHEAWVHGEPTPLLPGPAQHTLTLTP